MLRSARHSGLFSQIYCLPCCAFILQRDTMEVNKAVPLTMRSLGIRCLRGAFSLCCVSRVRDGRRRKTTSQFLAFVSIQTNIRLDQLSSEKINNLKWFGFNLMGILWNIGHSQTGGTPSTKLIDWIKQSNGLLKYSQIMHFSVRNSF